jgi:hypothetical protein
MNVALVQPSLSPSYEVFVCTVSLSCKLCKPGKLDQTAVHQACHFTTLQHEHNLLNFMEIFLAEWGLF